MLSLHQAIEIQASLLAYLKATFTFQDKRVERAFFDFINHPTEGLFKGPYLSLKPGFVKVAPELQAAVPLEIKPSWEAYDHQVKAWQRLSTREQTPAPTLITTGTGSGKTESFLYPILDYCYREQARPGIKVIILYPMNALATDQAKRLAEAIDRDDRLRGRITAGLFIGEGKDAATYPKSMGPDHIIENRESILSSPPDILLTNFKMLDYGLMKANYHDLWVFNLRDPELLRFLVLDELHTYDGAQGTDVANLIRRLKLKLNLPKGQLCPVGTSATLGSGAEAAAQLAAYATRIFGEPVGTESILTENRIKTSQIFGEEDSLHNHLPHPDQLKDASLRKNEDFDTFIQRQIDIWQLDADDLVAGLKRQQIVKDLVTVCNSGRGIHTLEEIEQGLSQINAAFRAIPQWDEAGQFGPKRALVESLFALISVARQKDVRKSPFLYSQTQLWIRELSGVLREVGEKPVFTWRELAEKQAVASLPPWFCRECGATGWLGVKQDNREKFEKDIKDLYDKFFSNHKNIYFISASADLSEYDLPDSGYEPSNFYTEYVGKEDLHFYEESAEDRVRLFAVRKVNDKTKAEHVCPACNTRNTLSIIGTRIATLSSVAISQTLATDLDRQPEKNRKVLAFTNSVQDAAHQAGFIEARNYRFTLRSSLQKIINLQAGPTQLSELATIFKYYWKEWSDESGHQPLDAYYYRFYPKDYLGKSDPEDYKEKGRYELHFQREFDHRMDWEIYAEFGYDSLIGRTLEKTGASAAYFEPVARARTWEQVQRWLAIHDPSRQMSEEDFRRFLVLLLQRIRVRGAISHPYLEKFRTSSLKLWDLNWMKDSRHFLNKRFGPDARFPRLLTSQPETRGVLDSTFAKNTNWFHAYFKKSFPMSNDHTDYINEFYAMLFPAMEAAGLMDRRQSGDVVNYALNPSAILVAQEVWHLRCTHCSDEIHTGEKDSPAVGGKCLHYKCKGIYELEAGRQENYYQAVYNRKRSPRVYAADHTGLLERQVREELEIDFKTRPNFNSRNAMVATSTLEMGIDIGTLNSVYNNAVPPLPANFLQRIGRAGRSSGSAFVINFVQNKAHDLFYYQGPFDMMVGEVATPGCYLEAREILLRHFFAFCIDTWTSAAPQKHHIPSYIRYLKLPATDMQDSSFFMNQLLHFIKVRESELVTRFRSQYEGEVRGEVFEEMVMKLKSEQFYQFYRSIFRKLKAEIAFIEEKRQDIQDLIVTLKLGKEDPERIELEQERKNLGGIIRSIKDRNTLEHMTNVGALPNYAFPETGVTLNARVLGNQAEGSSHPPKHKEYEMVRSSMQAIKEFAPDNYFYSQGYRFQITGVNTFDWADSLVYHRKRFCSQCDHIEVESLAGKGNCPKCGHESWGSASNVHSFAKLLTVKSFNSRSDARLNDNKDERELLIYHRMRHFDFKAEDSLGAWALTDIPFGIEFVKNVTIQDSNLGRKDIADARKMVINELELPVHGFITCRHCGKSSSNIHQRDYKQHYGFCKHKQAVYEGKSDEVFEEVFFFREMKTEAMKVLLPVQELNSEAEVKMFLAGIERGLKEYYRGNPQHIDLAEYKEYNHQTMRFDRYVVLFDRVPGGTGYLEQLFDRNEFTRLLRQAYEAIRDCSCQHEGKDGCYRCIYSYSNQYYQSDLSRSRAEKRFEAIVSKAEGWELQTGGLSQVAATGRIEESELEERLVRSISQFAAREEKWSFREVNEDGKISYTLAYEDHLQKIAYHIRPQVDLGPVNGVAYSTRTDFLIICTQAIVGEEDHREAIPQIALYLDGYQYHASAENNRFLNDWKKRKAINDHPAYLTWTLTWRDIDQFDQLFLDEKEQDSRIDNLYERLKAEGYRETRKKLISTNRSKIEDISQAKNNLERLLSLMQYPFRDETFQLSWSLYLSYFQQKIFYPSYSPEAIDEAFSGDTNDAEYCLTNKTLDGWIRISALDPMALAEFRTIVNVGRKEVRSKLQMRSAESIDKEDWNQFWAYYNLVQLFEVEEVAMFDTQATAGSGVGTAMLECPDEVLSLYEPVYAQLLQKLYSKGYVQTVEEETALNSLVNEAGEEIAMAELIIPHLKIVFKPLTERDHQHFQSAGYTMMIPEQANQIEL